MILVWEKMKNSLVCHVQELCMA